MGRITLARFWNGIAPPIKISRTSDAVKEFGLVARRRRWTTCGENPQMCL